MTSLYGQILAARHISKEDARWLLRLACIFPDCRSGVAHFLGVADLAIIANPGEIDETDFGGEIDFSIAFGEVPLFASDPELFYNLLAKTPTASLYGLVKALSDASGTTGSVYDGSRAGLIKTPKHYFRTLEDVRVYLRSKDPEEKLYQERFRRAMQDADGQPLVDGRALAMPRTARELKDAGDFLNICTGGHVRRVMEGSEARLFVMRSGQVEYVIIVDQLEASGASKRSGCGIVGAGHRSPSKELCRAILHTLCKIGLLDLTDDDIEEIANSCP